MTVYRIADGHDQEASFADINPQPASEAVRMPELVYYGNGQAEFNGTPFADLVWSGLSRAQYSALRTQLGVSDTVASNDVTIRLRLNSDSFGNYNAPRNGGLRGRSTRIGSPPTAARSSGYQDPAPVLRPAQRRSTW